MPPPCRERRTSETSGAVRHRQLPVSAGTTWALPSPCAHAHCSAARTAGDCRAPLRRAAERRCTPPAHIRSCAALRAPRPHAWRPKARRRVRTRHARCARAAAGLLACAELTQRAINVAPASAVVFYVTTTASTLKLKSEISRISQILQANGVAFEEARRLRPHRDGARASRFPPGAHRWTCRWSPRGERRCSRPARRACCRSCTATARRVASLCRCRACAPCASCACRAPDARAAPRSTWAILRRCRRWRTRASWARCCAATEALRRVAPSCAAGRCAAWRCPLHTRGRGALSLYSIRHAKHATR